jgi:hypothetical protein
MPSRSPPAGGSDPLDDLAVRAHAAIEAARETVARSEVLAAAMNLQRDDESLLVRCAWCDRYSLGSEWMTASELPHVWGVGRKLHEERVTHSICPDCSNVPEIVDED